ncbi:MAG: helix-turn-helix domain-containing protein [Chloroflexi bacterium]|nr:helix-turn-helix domain-containing protein [Chloroflexota bacterium]
MDTIRLPEAGGRREYYTVSEAARLLEVSTATVWRWIDAGELTAFRVGRRKIRIKREELYRLIRPARPEKGDMEKEREPTEPKSKRLKEKLLSLAGVWSDLDADRLIEEIYKARHEAPPSAPAKA